MRDEGRANTEFTSGLSLGAGRYQVNLSDKAYIDGDPILFRADPVGISPDLGVGVSVINRFKNNDVATLGFSAPQILGQEPEFSDGNKVFDVKRVPHFFGTFSYFWDLGDDNYLEFSSWVRKVKTLDLNYDFNVRYKFDDRMWIGAGLSSSGIIHTEIGMYFHHINGNTVKGGYSFNPTFATHSVIFGNIHELTLSYLLAK